MSWARWMSSTSVREMLNELNVLLDTKESWAPLVIREETDLLGQPAILHAVVVAFPKTPPQFSFSVYVGGVASGISGIAPLTMAEATSGTSSHGVIGKVTTFTGTIDLSTTLPLRLLRSVTESMKSWPDAESPRSTLGEVSNLVLPAS